ncbi:MULTISPECIES: type I restriction enzyme HsdR N-terminal domain-containing protein [Cellulophaga]|uniref:Restriction endonuclease, type I, EcoRI, R subunit/Type III n=1 Tax=Cellulophaga lytica (strain ATCC 23178 / DSM 7489 / JCM 8516 / NBRC 14961 / NCIMB 1423 / VKM B-1433 / Cy l20) TaxID=867900 RepID=F0RB16_CELLC|nr:MULTISPECIES: type I restriction enzyme HsdR N-terminal domain-containing protein [Cellulophaga]ADY30593.1 Restriction endonuclease, type I, EcoRI, R subunit/Type III [Cellulophaga lytica DSM 7489]MDO6853157.1 type I restriction enzyme HsdR N-terminal domain-containing protein [Cellulophaga lytica]TVZ10092.1 type I restriction and modification enzyme subunit R-like protein [Cellulophaga sp. RHA_52]WQG78480.1 type I restriction enzyme HsdR N-terminal domain-containing protein [Cellulophaga ly
MQKLNFSTHNFRFKNSENKVYIFDVIRKKFVVLQPEEWVRQHVVHHLIHQKKYPISLINVEKQLVINDLKKRYDVVVFKPNGNINILVECKAPEITITQATFDQIARYNMQLDANYLMVTNGLNHFYCKTNSTEDNYTFLRDIPDFNR